MSKEETSIVYKINDHFKMPIYYNKSKIELKNNQSTDIHLEKPK